MPAIARLLQKLWSRTVMKGTHNSKAKESSEK